MHTPPVSIVQRGDLILATRHGQLPVGWQIVGGDSVEKMVRDIGRNFLPPGLAPLESA